MAEHIGAVPHMVQPTEQQLINTFEHSVYMAEMPISTLHCAGKIILSEYVRSKGFKVVLTGEGSDEVRRSGTLFPGS
jgi:asparagine synthase (glutamine-hydrolysing)